MICQKCQGESLADCSCPDIEERMRSIYDHGKGPFILAWCKTCDKVFERCTCNMGEVH